MRQFLLAAVIFGIASVGVAADDATRQLAFEIRVVTVPAALVLPAAPAKDGEVVVFSDAQRTAFLSAAQADRRVTILQAPKITLFHGQESTVKIAQSEMFVTGLDAQLINGETVVVTKTTRVETGSSFTLRGQLSTDEKMIAVDAGYVHVRADRSTGQVPVTTMVTPVFEGGSQGVLGPMTLFLQLPKTETIKIEKTAMQLPIGGHAVIAGPGFVQESRSDFGPPVLSKVPYINRLFKSVGVAKVPTRTYLLVAVMVVDEN